MRLVSRGLFPAHAPTGYAVAFEVRRGAVSIVLDTVVVFQAHLTGATAADTEANYVREAARLLQPEVDAFMESDAEPPTPTEPDEPPPPLRGTGDARRLRYSAGNAAMTSFVQVPWQPRSAANIFGGVQAHVVPPNLP